MQVTNQFEIKIDKQAVRHILKKHYKGEPDDHNGPSWLSFLGHTKDSLWSVDLFRVESIVRQSFWVMVVMDQFTRRIVGFAVHRGNTSGIDLCNMFQNIALCENPPKRLSSQVVASFYKSKIF